MNLLCFFSLLEVISCLNRSINCFSRLFVTNHFKSGNLSFITSFSSGIESFFSLKLFLQFFRSSLVALSKLLHFGFSFLSLDLKEDFSMFGDLNLLLLLCLNVLEVFDVLSDFFLLCFVFLDLLEDLSMLFDFLIFLLFLQLLCLSFDLFECSCFLESFSMFCNFFFL